MTLWGPITRWTLRGAVALFIVLAILPLGAMALASWTGPGGPAAAYHGVLSSARSWALLGNSLAVAGGAALGAMLLGAPLAFALTRVRVPFRWPLAALFALPMALPPYVFALAWVRLLGRYGPLNAGAQWMTGDAAPIFSPAGLPATLVVLISCYYPVVMLTTGLALASGDAGQEEAARLYVGWRRALFGVTLRQAVPGCLAGGLLVFVLALGNFGVPSLLEVPVYVLEVFTNMNALYDVPAAAAAAMPLVALCLVAMLLFRGRQRRLARATVSTHRRRPGPLPLGAWRWGVWAVCLAVILVSVLLPMGMLLFQAGGPASYVKAFDAAAGELRNSLLLAAAAATVMTLWGFLLAYLAARDGSWFAGCGSVAALMAFAVPGTVLGIGLIKVWNRPAPFGWVYDCAAISMMACVIQFTAVAQWGCAAALDLVDEKLEAAAAVSGLSWGRNVAGVLTPLLWPAVLGVWCVTFILSLGELNACVLVNPPGFSTVTVRLFSLMHYGMDQLVAALAVLLAACTLVPLIALAATARWYARRTCI